MNELKKLGSELNDQEQVSGLLCPRCNGGSTSERSLSMKRSGNQVSYVCHRASCDGKGYFLVVGAATKATAVKTSVFAQALSKLEQLPTDLMNELTKKYSLMTTDFARLEVKWQPDMRRVCYPILSPERIIVGWTLRSYEKDVKPKSYKAITNFNLPALSYYRCWTTSWSKLLIVEDQVSACRAANTVSAVALCGTNLNLAMARHIRRLEPRQVVICLDADAFGESIKMKERWGDLLANNNCKVVKPPRDLKDMNCSELRTFINKSFGE